MGALRHRPGQRRASSSRGCSRRTSTRGELLLKGLLESLADRGARVDARHRAGAADRARRRAQPDAAVGDAGRRAPSSSLCRSFHPVIVAILFVKAVGFGALAGILALMVASVGFIGKLFTEAIEEISLKQVEAVRATGAPFASVLAFGVLPQVFSRFIGFATYQLDSNLRNSTMVGIVGAGGIGGTLFAAFQRFDYDFVCAILISIIALIMVGEVLATGARDLHRQRDVRRPLPPARRGVARARAGRRLMADAATLPRAHAERVWRRFTPRAAADALRRLPRDRRGDRRVGAHGRGHPGIPVRRARADRRPARRACGRSTGALSGGRARGAGRDAAHRDARHAARAAARAAGRRAGRAQPRAVHAAQPASRS